MDEHIQLRLTPEHLVSHLADSREGRRVGDQNTYRVVVPTDGCHRESPYGPIGRRYRARCK